MAQKINLEELQDLAQNGQKERDRELAADVIRASRGGRINVTYVRQTKGEGRWYAKGRAQLQSCSKGVRTAALKGVGFEIDIRASYPAILVGMAREMRRRKCAQLPLTTVERYINNL